MLVKMLVCGYGTQSVRVTRVCVACVVHACGGHKIYTLQILQIRNRGYLSLIVITRAKPYCTRYVPRTLYKVKLHSAQLHHFLPALRV